MLYIETELPGAFFIELERLQDERGFFARSWCQREFTEHGLDPCVVQCNISYNKNIGTLRGMHFQMPPFAEAKLVRCTRGVLYDVIVDLRSNSPTYLRWTHAVLTAENHTALYIPKGFAHGFQTLENETEIFYQMSEFYVPEAARGIRWNDPVLNIRWPITVSTISAKDLAYDDFVPAEFAGILA